MKKFIAFIVVAGWVLTSYSQDVIHLEETTLTFEPTAEIVFEDYANGVIKVKENYQRQFQMNAIAFINENFDINRFRQESGIDSGDIYVTVTSSNGQLNAVYNEQNQLVHTTQKFSNVPLPYDVRNQIYASNKGWVMTKNKYIAYGKMDQIDSEKYLVVMEKGNDRERLKITPARSTADGVAMVEKF